MSDTQQCTVCDRPIPGGRRRRTYCSDRCRNKAFRERQAEMGRKRTRLGYLDGMSAWEARDVYGATA
jgi:predicted nucleic acid-binding Zn ribbon protein